MPPRQPKASGPPLQQQKLLLPDGSSTRSGKASGAAAAPPRDPGAAPPVRRSIQKTGGHRADARRLRWEEPSGTEPAGTTANLWSFSDGMVRELFRKNGALRVDSKLMPDVKFELHEMVQALVNDIHAVAFPDDPEGPPRLAGQATPPCDHYLCISRGTRQFLLGEDPPLAVSTKNVELVWWIMHS